MMDLNEISARIRQNQETSLRVVLTPRVSSSALAEWIAALQVNESVTRVELLCNGPFLHKASNTMWHSLLGAILGLPNLESFQMRGCSSGAYYNTEECGIPMTAFASLRSSSLSLFSLSQLVLLCGSATSSLQSLTSALQGQKALKEFQLISIGLVDETAPEEGITTSALEPLLKTLAELPQLENLEVSGTFTPLGVLEEAPHSFFQSKSLKRLSVSDFIFPEAALASAWEDLSKNFDLKELAISGNLTSKVSAPKLTQLLKHNKTLEALALRVDSFDDEESNQELVSAIGSSHLKVVSLCNFFGGPISSTQTRNALAKMLESNCSLEYLYVPVPFTDKAFWQTVRLYLGLNCAGRKKTEKKQPVEDNKSNTSISRSFYLMANKNASGGPCLTPTKQRSKTTMITLADVAVEVVTAESPGKRHQRLVDEARSAKKRRFPVVPTLGQSLSSMFIR